MSSSTDRRVGSDAHAAVWAAIQQYVVACGGDPNQVTNGRMDAVAAIERAIDQRAAELVDATRPVAAGRDLCEPAGAEGWPPAGALGDVCEDAPTGTGGTHAEGNDGACKWCGTRLSSD